MRWDLNQGWNVGQNFLLVGPKNMLERLMTLEFICNFMSTAKFIKIGLILFVLASVGYGVSVQNFPQYVETGSTVFSGFQPLSGCLYARQDITMTLLIDKGTTAYNPMFSIQGLKLGQSNSILTVRLFLTTHTSSTVTVGLDTKCSFRLAQITIRYVVIVPPLVSFVNLVYLTRDDGPGLLLKDSSNKVTMNQVLPLVANQTKSALFLMGFHIENRQPSKTYIDIFCKETVADNGVTVDVTTNSNNNYIYLYHISLVVITVNTNFTFQTFTGTFQVVTDLHNYQGGSLISSLVSTTTLYSNSTTFVGIRGFKNIENNQGLFFDFTISSALISLQANTTQHSINSFSMNFINFVFSTSSCTAASPYTLNGTCYSTCPSSFFGNNATKTCDNCSSSCAACDISNVSCTSCPNRFYLSNSTCISCPVQCLLCTSPTACSSCVAPPYIFSSGSCLVDCSSISQCNLCILVGSAPQCTNCSTNYRVNGGGCVGICGDGVVVTGQACDDANSQDNDGCSSSCMQESYFTCTSATPGATSTCSLNGISLVYDHTVKVKTGNAFTSFFKVSPNMAMMQGIDWLSGISITNPAITPSSSSYDASTGKLSILSSYTADVGSESPVTFSFNYAAMSSLLATIPASANSQALVTQNNLALQYYPDSAYKFAAFVEYFSLFLAVIAWLMVVAGYACGKLIVLEHVAVMQVAYLCMQTVHDASPTFQGLRWLRLSAGNTMPSQSDYSSGVSRELKGAYFSLNMLESYNIAFAMVLLPIIAAGVVKILSGTACKSHSILERVWPPLLAGTSFYGLVFTAYIIFSQLFISFLYIGSGVGTVYMGLVISFCQSLLMGVYCYYLNKMREAFGDFKKKFEKYNICQYYYTFVVVERFLTAMLVILLRNNSFGLAVAALPLLAQLIFVAVRRPYVCGDNRRPIINLTFSALIMGCNLMGNLLPSVSAVQVCMPVIICLLLTVGTCLNLYHLVCEVKEVYFTQAEKAKGKGQADAAQEARLGKPVLQGIEGSILNRLFKFEQTETVDQKNRVQFQFFKQKIINGADAISINFNLKTLPAEEDSIQKEMLSYQWDNYPIVTNNKPILQHMRAKIQQDRIEEAQEDEY